MTTKEKIAQLDSQIKVLDEVIEFLNKVKRAATPDDAAIKKEHTRCDRCGKELDGTEEYLPGRGQVFCRKCDDDLDKIVEAWEQSGANPFKPRAK